MPTIQCPNLVCRAVLQIPEKVRGKKIRCGKCGTTFMVPYPSQGSSSDDTPQTAKQS